MNAIVHYIENEIDYKYQSVFLKLIKDDLISQIGDRKYLIYYRKLGKIVDASKITNLSEMNDHKSEFPKINTVPRLLKFLNENSGILVTGYNFKKRGINKFPNITVINIGHSISGNTSYNVRTWSNPSINNNYSVVPKFFFSLKRLKGFKKLKVNDNHKLVNTFYKLLYNFENEPKSYEGSDKSILFLPHWTNPILNIKRMVECIDIPEGFTLRIKLHPASIYETKIFKNRTQLKGVRRIENSEHLDSEESQTKEDYYDEVFEAIKNMDNVEIYNDDEFELLTAIDNSDYVVFDGCSNTLTETLIRDVRFNTNKKIAVLDPIAYDRSYIMPDLFGYDKLSKLSIDDFKVPNKELMVSYLPSIVFNKEDLKEDIKNQYINSFLQVIKG